MTLLLCFLIAGHGTGFEILRDLQSPNATTEEFVTVPYAADFTADGRLFLLDSTTSRIFVWDNQGRFLKAFGNKGVGPHEIWLPSSLKVTDDALYIRSANRNLKKFDHEGKFLAFIKAPANRVFAPLEGSKILFGDLRFEDAGDHRAVFELLDVESGKVDTVKSFVDETFLTIVNQPNKRISTSYRPDLDIQRGPDGKWYFGYGKNGTLYKLDGNGKLLGEKKYSIPRSKPSKEDIAFMKDMPLVMFNGRQRKLNEMPGLQFNYGYEKGAYTRFYFTKDKAVFVLTPLGGFTGVGTGYFRGSYYVCDFQSGKLLHRGEYRMPEGSVLFFRNGRVLAVIVDDEGDYLYKEIRLMGSQ